MSTNPKRPRDPNQLAALIAGIATGESADDSQQKREKDPAAVALGRKGGLKGGKARAESMTPERRREIAAKAAAKRWKKEP
ncbi:MAG TPA: hypothetical protein VJ724_05455 [Tahibacter sp.]|nr:hypothetical protein [Tahibacter sp.]